MLEKTVDKEAAPAEQGTDEQRRPRPLYSPRTDIIETEEGIVVRANMPGVNEDNLEITLEKNQLLIRGRVGSNLPSGYRLTYQEYEVGDFERRFVLPNEIDRARIQAELTNGVLNVNLPKLKEATPQRITVKTR